MLMTKIDCPSANTALTREERIRQKLDPAFSASEAEVLLAGGGREKSFIHKADAPSTPNPWAQTFRGKLC